MAPASRTRLLPARLQIDGELVEAPVPLPWYPHKLAWQFNFSRSQARAGWPSFPSRLAWGRVQAWAQSRSRANADRVHY